MYTLQNQTAKNERNFLDHIVFFEKYLLYNVDLRKYIPQ